MTTPVSPRAHGLFGRLDPHPPETHPRVMGDAFLRATPTVPAKVDRVSAIAAWPMFLNDRLGDCVPAGMGHGEEVWSGYGTGKTVVVTDNDVTVAYENAGGYVPGRPSTDRGCVIQDALDVWRKTGIAGHKIAAYAELNVKNFAQLKQALYLFGVVMIGVNFPASAMTQFDDGQPWDVVKNDGGIEGGHCVILQYAATGENYKVITWGAVQEVTEAWLSKYMEEAWAPISLEWLSASGVDTDGLDADALNAAFERLTDEPGPFPASPQPTPDPTPTPEPTPTPDPTPSVVAALIAFLKNLMEQIQAFIKSLGG